MTASQLIKKYISFFEKRGHKRIPNAPLVPQNDPTTLFTSSGMQPLVPYLLGAKHPMGKRLINVQNSFRAGDIDEVGDNRHTTFFRMLGNWSLGDYFKKEQLPWFFEFLTKELKLDPKKLYVSVFQGFNDISQDEESADIWKELFQSVGIDPKERVLFYGVEKNWWSRSGLPQNMPKGEPGGPDSEVFFDSGTPHDKKFGNHCHINCNCGRFLEIGNSVFMQFKKTEWGFEELPQKNVDFGGGLERLLAAAENKADIFQTNLFVPIIKTIERISKKKYADNAKEMRVVADHFIASIFITANHITPSNKEHGYILRRLIRRGLDHMDKLGASKLEPILEAIVIAYKETDPYLKNKYVMIKNTILEEEQKYTGSRNEATKFIRKKYSLVGGELKGVRKISALDAFTLYTTHGLSPSQIKSLGLEFNEQQFAELMRSHQELSKKGAEKKFKGGLADTNEKTIMGHTATHLMHQALRDVLGNHVHQTGSNITSERVRFDFNFDRNLTTDEIEKVQDIINEKIKENLPVHFEMLPLKKAKEIGAIGLFDEKYEQTVKVYFIGPKTKSQRPYSIEFCGGPHVEFTEKIKKVTIIKQENIGKGNRRLYATVE